MITTSPRPPSPSVYFPYDEQRRMENLSIYCAQSTKGITVFNREEEGRLTLLVSAILPGNLSLNEFGETVSLSQSHCYVLKWTDPLELASTRLLAEFTVPLDFVKVPKTTATLPQGIDLATKYSPVSDLALLPLQETLNKVRAYFTEKAPQKENCVMHSQKIEAQSLDDFFATGYSKLDQEEQESFLRRLGRIAYLDFALGFTDRLLQVGLNDLVEDDLEADILESANLDNILVQTQAGQKGVSFHLIDNALNASFIQHPEPYKKLLTELLSYEDFDQKIANMVVSALLSSLQDAQKTQSVAKLLRSRKDNLTSQVAAGIQTMDKTFSSIVVSSWENKGSFHDHLHALHPTIVKTISDRILAVQTARENRTSPSRHRHHSSSSLTPSEVIELIRRNLDTPTSPEMRRAVIPKRDENTTIETIFTLADTLRTNGPNNELLQQLQQLIEQMHPRVASTVPPTPKKLAGEGPDTPNIHTPAWEEADSFAFDEKPFSLEDHLPKPTPKK